MVEKEIKLFEAFAGIGSQHKALNNISKKMNWTIKSVGIIEWFVPAICAYVELHSKSKKVSFNDKDAKYFQNVNLSMDSKKLINNNAKSKIIEKYLNYLIISQKEFNNTFDISNTTYHQISKNIDIFTYSFPCQDLSNQGKQRGMNKGSKTRSGLLWEVERLFIDMKNNFKQKEMPKYLLLENVAQIGNYKNINNLNLWIKTLEKIGYETKIYYLNSSNFNSCQNRERAYGLSIRKDWKEKVKFEFPDLENINSNKKKSMTSILENKSDSSLFLNDLDKYERSSFILTKSNINKCKLIGYTNFSSESYIYDPNFTGPTLTASGANSRIKILQNNKIRKLLAKECIKYMGFTANDFNKIKKTNLNDIKIIYLAGNSIVVNVLEEIFKSLKF